MTRALRNTLILAAVPLALALLAGAVIAVPAWILLLMGTTFEALMVSLDRSGCQDLELLRRKPR